MGKDSLRSDESRFRQSERMVAIWEERKRQRAEAATSQQPNPMPGPQAEVFSVPPQELEQPRVIDASAVTVGSVQAFSAQTVARPDGLALAPIGMFDVARYHRLKKFYAKRKAAASQRR